MQQMEHKQKNNKMYIVADLGVGGERGRIFYHGSIGTISATEYKDPEKVIKKWQRKKQCKF